MLELRVAEMRQLFNAMDPAPFRERDLDPKAVEYILEWGRETRRGQPLGLIPIAPTVFWGPMAFAIMGGLLVATLLTLILLPVLYVMVFGNEKAMPVESAALPS